MRKTAVERPCANEECGRPAPEGERFCEGCALERDLFRRDLRAGTLSAPPRPGAQNR